MQPPFNLNCCKIWRCPFIHWVLSNIPQLVLSILLYLFGDMDRIWKIIFGINFTRTERWVLRFIAPFTQNFAPHLCWNQCKDKAFWNGWFARVVPYKLCCVVLSNQIAYTNIRRKVLTYIQTSIYKYIHKIIVSLKRDLYNVSTFGHLQGRLPLWFHL